MFRMRDLNVPITLDCNLRCRYCFRDSFEKPKGVPALSDFMRDYLRDYSDESVTLTGGEPFTHFDVVKDVFSCVPEGVGKSVITNGTLLTREIVDYVNGNGIGLLLSHDGVGTEYLRGVDVLKDKNKCALLREVKKLRISSVATSCNTDVWANFFYIAKKLERLDFGYFSGPLMDTERTRYLVDGFDYDLYIRTLFEFVRSPYYRNVRRGRDNKCIGFSVLLDGTVCGNINVSACYGTVDDGFLRCREKADAMGDFDYCRKTRCPHDSHCRFLPQGATEHSCKCRRMIMDRGHSREYLEEVSAYVMGHLDEIEKKYGWDASCLRKSGGVGI